ncbi:MAG: hypothetical protein K8R36_03260 [Planctomycetales bacterium]|nr:hypothetical protein [Planctomycetales bacterium]
MRLFFFGRKWHLAAGAAGLGILGAMAPQMFGVETRPVKKPSSESSKKKDDKSRIAERIGLDPSIRETPSLPAEGKGPARARITDADPAEADAPPREGAPETRLKAIPEPEKAAELISKAWPVPVSLLADLDNLAQSDPLAAEWVSKAKAEIHAILQLPTLADSAAVKHFGNLGELAHEAKSLARKTEDDDARSRILRAGFAIVRRQAIWEPLHAAAAEEANGKHPEQSKLPSSQQILASLQRAQEELAKSNDLPAWRKYLMLDQLREVCTTGAEISPAERKLARDILYRYHSTQLSTEQAGLLERPALRNFAEQLAAWGYEPVDLLALAATIEKYESAKESTSAIALAEMYDLIRWSSEDETSDLADAVNAYYRNANVRVAISAELVNRLLPKEMRTAEPVQDMIQGASVQGQSETSTRLRLVLLPDRFRWRLGLEAKGEVASSTASTAGPATFYQDGAASYRARKLLTVDRKSIRMHEAEAEAAAQTQLNDFETDFDGIPLFNALARLVARNQYDMKSPAATLEVENKIINRAAGTLDTQVAERMEKAKAEFQNKLLSQLQKLHLDPTAVDLETTQDRLIARYRLAGREQLSAHTPRPQAPGDSLLSVQVHETALNNALDHLKLTGRKIELHELFKEMTTRFSDQKISVPEDLPEGVFVTFADHDAVRIDNQDGRLRIRIHLKELSITSNHKTFKNLIVTGYYKPHPDQLDANLERDGIIELGGNRLGAGERLMLAGIFEKVLSRNRKLNLVNERISKSPQLKDQQVTQFVIHDGWIGVALGPKLPSRTALQTKIPARQKK